MVSVPTRLELRSMAESSQPWTSLLKRWCLSDAIPYATTAAISGVVHDASGSVCGTHKSAARVF